MLRMLVALAVSSLFGLLCGLLSRSQNKARLLAFSVVSAFLGLIAVTVLQCCQPVLFDHYLCWKSWFEWVPYFNRSDSLLLLSRSLCLLPLGFLAGFALSKIRAGHQSLASYLPLAAFLSCFALIWVSQAELLPGGVESKTYVYRFPGANETAAQSEEWRDFLQWNSSPFFGYEVLSRDRLPHYLDADSSALSDPAHPPVFLFVKEYWVNGKRTSCIYTSLSGQQTSHQLGEFFRNFASSRCSP